MTKEEFEILKCEQKESGKSIKAYLSGRGICFTSYYYWKKKFEQANPEVSLVPVEIHNDTDSHFLSIDTSGNEPVGVSVAFPNGLKAHFGRGSEGVLMEVLRKSLGEPCSL